MRSLWVITFVVMVCFTGGSAVAEIALFKGEPVYATGITISGWGSGTALEAGDRCYEGSRSIRVNTQGLHQGGCINFKTPIDILGEQFNDSTYLQFVIGFSSVVRSDVAGGSGPFGVMSMPGMPFAGSYNSDSIPTKPVVNSIRLVIVSADGHEVEVTQDVPTKADDGWYRIAVPLKSLGFKQGEAFPVSRILMFSDVPDSIYVGEIATAEDKTPITCTCGDDRVEAVSDPVTFTAEAEGGGSQLLYSWNFGDHGPEGEDAAGPIATHVFKKGGDFTVKLTVTDVSGIKAPATSTCLVSVNDGT